MGSINAVVAAAVAFVGSHFLLSHPLRRPIVGAIGEKGFQGVVGVDPEGPGHRARTLNGGCGSVKTEDDSGADPFDTPGGAALAFPAIRPPAGR